MKNEHAVTGSYSEKDNQGSKVLRWNIKKKYTREALKAQRKEFSAAAASGKTVCLSDLMINHGM